jgi:hypothetical protein
MPQSTQIFQKIRQDKEVMIGFYKDIFEPSKLGVRLLELRNGRGVARLKRRGEGFLFATSLTRILIV